MQIITFAEIMKNQNQKAKALFTVNFSYLHYNVFVRGCEAISGRNYKTARNCLTFTFKYIVIQMGKDIFEKGYCFASFLVAILFFLLLVKWMKKKTIKMRIVELEFLVVFFIILYK